MAVAPPCQISGTAFITGGGSGIGKAIAAVYAQNGINNLALVDINEETLQAAKQELGESFPGIRVEVFTANVTKEESVAAAVQSAVEAFGRIDISVHGAGVAHRPTPTHELPIEEWQRVIDINQTGVFICEKLVISQMLKQESKGGNGGRGIIVNISSILGLTAPDSRMGAAAYVASKHAVIGLSKSDAKLYAKDDIRINAICPGYVDTPLIHDSIVTGQLAMEIEKHALKRPAEAVEIANAVLFLSSPMASFMCGASLVVDGGYTI